MKISLTKKTDRQGRKWVVLLVDKNTDRRIFRIVKQQIVPFPQRMRRKVKGGKVKYTFKPEKLDKVVLTFPYAELSPGVDRLMSQQAFREYEDRYRNIPEVEVPGFEGELFDFQKVGVSEMSDHLTRYGAFLNNDEMGLGKTIQALATAQLLEDWPALVIVPNTAKYVWYNLAEQFLPGLKVQVVEGTAAQRRAQLENAADLFVINFESIRLHPELETMDWKLVIVDEFHRIKNPRAKQTKAIHRIPAAHKILMSGTPMINGRAEELWSPLRYAFPMSINPSYYMFEKAYCIREGYNIVGYRNLEGLRDFLHKHSIRRRKDQVLPDLPERVYATRYVDRTPEEKRLYKSIKEDLMLWMEDGEPKPIATVLAQVTRLKQACFSPELYGGSHVSSKMGELKEIVAELVANGEKAIVFSQWAKAVKIMERELAEYEPAIVTGKVKGTKRQAQVKRFQEEEECKLFLGTIGACREAITLTAATYVIFTDKGWTPAENEQAAARAHRIGTTETVHIIELQSKNTIEERIEQVLARKQQMSNSMIERDGGADLGRITVEDIRDIL